MLSFPAVALGAGGLVPFVALSKPGQAMVDHESLWLGAARQASGRRTLNATECQVTYACTILSFLGGPHWGLALAARATRLRQRPCFSSKNAQGPQSIPVAGLRAAQLLWGVTPPLLAWPAASLPAPASLDLLAVGLTASLVVDAAFAFVKHVPSTYLLLRTPLTLVAVWSLHSNRAATASPPLWQQSFFFFK